MRSRTAWFVVFVIVGLLAAPASAQITQGRLTGIVTDTQGAVMPGVTVTVTSPALIGTRTTVSEADGRYLFPALPTGVYRVTFDLSGFRKFDRDNIQVVLGQTIAVDAQMQVGGLDPGKQAAARELIEFGDVPRHLSRSDGRSARERAGGRGWG